MVSKLGLILGGGGSRGLAHIGILEMLMRENITPHVIVGTSMGAIIGTAYALGIQPHEVEAYMGTVNGTNLLSLNLFSAKARQQKVKEHLYKFIGEKTFEDTAVKLALMAVDAVTGKEVAITSGKLLPAVLASSALPVVFPPVNHMGMQLVDGGVVDALATHPAYELGADKIVAVDIWQQLDTEDIWRDPLTALIGDFPFGWFTRSSSEPTILSSLWRSFQIMATTLHNERLEKYPAHIILQPDVQQYGSLDFGDIHGPVQAGRRCAEAYRAEILALINT